MSRLRVLMYHKISTEKCDFLTVSKDQFRKQMVFIKKRYQPITLSELINLIKHNKQLPERAIIITFDDGYLNNYELAYPILSELKIPFTIFLVANYIGKTIGHDGILQSFLSAETLKLMQPLAEFGYHGLNHENIMDLPTDEWENTIEQCKKILNQEGIEMQASWAYTYGAFPKKDTEKMKRLREIFKKQDILCAFRIGNRINSWPLKKPFKIQRLDIRGDESFLKFKIRVTLGKISI
ncbi:MAG: polysaccharide deacetylase family protein [Bacteroidia bacterium]|nr:polysaccharide deacetylase family protein [Bacteroidia bacterium]